MTVMDSVGWPWSAVAGVDLGSTGGDHTEHVVVLVTGKADSASEIRITANRPRKSRSYSHDAGLESWEMDVLVVLPWASVSLFGLVVVQVDSRGCVVDTGDESASWIGRDLMTAIYASVPLGHLGAIIGGIDRCAAELVKMTCRTT